MTTVTENKYTQIKREFYHAHGQACNEQTTSDGGYHVKQVNFEGGACWYEISKTVVEKITGEVHGVPYSFPLLLTQTEFWSTDNGDSAYVYTKATKDNV